MLSFFFMFLIGAVFKTIYEYKIQRMRSSLTFYDSNVKRHRDLYFESPLIHPGLPVIWGSFIICYWCTALKCFPISPSQNMSFVWARESIFRGTLKNHLTWEEKYFFKVKKIYNFCVVYSGRWQKLACNLTVTVSMVRFALMKGHVVLSVTSSLVCKKSFLGAPTIYLFPLPWLLWIGKSKINTKNTHKKTNNNSS